MRATIAISTSLMSLATNVLAAGNDPVRGGPGILAGCFLSFCLVMGLFQVLPALKLLAGKVRGFFHRAG